MVKIRPTQIDALVSQGHRGAKRVRQIIDHLDDYLSVCQVGITLTSIGLGFVGEPAFAALFHPLFAGWGAWSETVTRSVSVACGFLIVSYLHIVVGELIPKTVAIRITEKAVFWIALPIGWFRWLFLAPIWVLNTSVTLVLKPFRLSAPTSHTLVTDGEFRAILDQSEAGGMMSFRRLLYMENVLDLGSLTVRNAMQVKSKVQVLRPGMSWEAVHTLIGRFRYSRYPLVASGSHEPLGVVHVKDLYAAYLADPETLDLEALARPGLTAGDQDPLEHLLGQMQRTGNHVALVRDAAGRWTGIATLEDVLEEVVGTIEEEYPVEPPVTIAEFLKENHVLLDVEGSTLEEVLRAALARLPASELPADRSTLLTRILERERQAPSALSHHLAIPHGRVEGLIRPLVAFARPRDPIPVAGRNEPTKVLFILVTPAESPRIHQVLLSHIAGLYESDFFEDRLYESVDAAELHSVICTAEQTVLS
jgi:CBS domain containing-hemolysin-like protein